MNILIAGASGAIGRALIPLLIADGHAVTGTTRTDAKQAELAALGATPLLMDGLDAASVRRAVLTAEPDVIVHQMTALSGMKMGRIDTTFAATNRLRTEGLDHLIAAGAELATPPRLVVQSFAGWPLARDGARIKTEDAPLDPDPPKGIRETHAAIRRMEETTTRAGGIVLRYGGFYGPGTGLTAGGEQVEMVRARKIPVVGDGAGLWSLIHIEDAAEATRAAIERGTPGAIYHVVDDEPALTREWVPYLAQVAGAKPPRRVPAWVARLIAGPGAVMMMTASPGAANAKAKAELGWEPRHRTWREGFPEALQPATA